MSKAPALTHFEEVARRTIAAFPDSFRSMAQAVHIVVTDWPQAEMLRELGIEDRRDLTGLYDGIPVTEKSVWDMPLQPDTVWLFRQPILAEWRDRGDIDLDDLIAHVTVHEFAHHFGWSDANIAAIDRWWE